MADRFPMLISLLAPVVHLGIERVCHAHRFVVGPASAFQRQQGDWMPPEHERAGLVTVTEDAAGRPFDWREVTGDLLRIRAQRSAPSQSFARVRYRESWFYIEDSDLESKSTFSLAQDAVRFGIAEGRSKSSLMAIAQLERAALTSVVPSARH